MGCRSSDRDRRVDSSSARERGRREVPAGDRRARHPNHSSRQASTGSCFHAS